jgi:ribose/xylose/arabinose/galactoside ABC-type transport system permease subunit
MTTLTPAPPPGAPAPRRTAALLAHLGWEAILLVLVVIAAVVAGVQSDGDAFGRGLWSSLGALGLLAAAFALSLRTATPNLAVAAQATLAGVMYAELVRADWPGLIAGALVVVILLIYGLLLGVFTGLTSAPAWAVSLGGMAVAQSVAVGLAGMQTIPLPRDSFGGETAWLWAVVFVLGSVAGGAAFLVPGVRRFLGAGRASADVPGFQPSRLVGAVIGFGASSTLAALSGIAFTGYVGAALVTGGDRLLVAVAATVLGGVSVFTGRGGVAGTVLAVALLLLVDVSLRIMDVPVWASYSLVAGLAILFGIGVGRLLDKIAGPEQAP